MSVSTLFIGLDVVSCVLICLVTLGIVLGLVDFHLLLSILCVLLILSRLIRATISVFFVPYYPVLLSFYLVLSYMCELNKWRMEKRHKGVGCCALSDKMFSAARRMCSIRGCYRVEQIADCSTLWARRIQNSAVALRYMSVLSAAPTVTEDDRHAEFLQIGRSDAMDRLTYVSTVAFSIFVGSITESIRILVPVNRIKQKCFQITTKRVRRSQQFHNSLTSRHQFVQ